MTPAFRVPDDVGVIVSADLDPVYLAHLPAGPLLVLEGAAAVIWTQATTGSARGWVARVAELFGEPEDVISDQVWRFVSELAERRVLESAPEQDLESELR